MDYRTMKMNDNTIQVSMLGFGAMRFPQLPNGDIDTEMAKKLVDKAFQNGVNYIDTAWTYDDGTSELIVGDIIKYYDRESFFLADKLPKEDCRTYADVSRIFHEQLKKCGVEHFDFYLIHQLNKEWFERVKKLDIVKQLEAFKAEGKIKNLGFSFHDDLETFKRCVDHHHWDFVQIQLNYMDIHFQQGIEGYEYATNKNIPVIIMEPVKGGSLANFNKNVAALMTDHHPDRSLASWAFRWVGSLDNVKVILSGMSTLEQVEDNVNTFTNFEPMNEHEYDIIDKVRTGLMQTKTVNCTQCRYCMPCPEGVNIPINFREANEHNMYNNVGRLRYAARRLGELDMRADRCVACMACVVKCPQQIDIPTELQRFTALLQDNDCLESI